MTCELNCKYNTADLNRPCAFQTRTDTPDNYGGFATTWATTFSDMARIRQLSMREAVMYSDLRSPAMYEFIIRYRTGVYETMRILYNSMYYNIRLVDDVEEGHVWLRLVAERLVAD